MDTTGSDSIPACGASTNVLLREGKALYPKVIKTDGHHPEIGNNSKINYFIYFIFECKN